MAVKRGDRNGYPRLRGATQHGVWKPRKGSAARRKSRGASPRNAANHSVTSFTREEKFHSSTGNQRSSFFVQYLVRLSGRIQSRRPSTRPLGFRHIISSENSRETTLPSPHHSCPVSDVLPKIHRESCRHEGVLGPKKIMTQPIVRVPYVFAALLLPVRCPLRRHARSRPYSLSCSPAFVFNRSLTHGHLARLRRRT